ncbi:hypothetical protein FB567DRAFT_183047 [Paraphoma chrysanthemicola]|uniref:Uncharacterized protein n=1 Tax=Paraphoma chrysanthemicola TaxID=798071 RepID=A0A8K0VTR3_9PLEO|nr:hypothetical protein FB567DRAFT_183047 [Paraphoma chrysanthemicola]
MILPQSLIALVAALGFTAVAYAEFPDGTYAGEILSDGSYHWTSVTNSSETYTTAPNTGTPPATISARGTHLSKRRTDCWGTSLSHSGVDIAANGLRNWAGEGHQYNSGNRNAVMMAKSQGVMVYYCINRPHSSGNLDRADVDYALRQMDSKCRLYEAGWFGWDGSVEIVGKCRDSDAICLG